ncbi:hypothetical protein RG371_003610 [Acinetobacter baumannii]|nr:hypothetical protein [Acinetobacter baumannii]ELB1455712.1 hypothetical protein [Acinetobacter baumannii]
MNKYNVKIFKGNNRILHRTVKAGSIEAAYYCENIINNLKKEVGVSVLNLTYSTIYEFQGSAELWLSNTKTGRKMFRLEAIIVS